MLHQAGYEVTPANYAALVRALLLNKDAISAVEVLLEMESTGQQFMKSIYNKNTKQYSSKEFDVGQYASIKSLLVRAICDENPSSENKNKLDLLYDALLAQQTQHHNHSGDTNKAATTVSSSSSSSSSISSSPSSSMTVDSSGSTAAVSAISSSTSGMMGAVTFKIPRIVLDALVESAGRLNMLDRAFAIFQDYPTVFRVSPDIHSYNSLLAACALNCRGNVQTLLTVLNQMEATNSTSENSNTTGSAAADTVATIACQPNDISYTILIEAMLECNEYRIFDQVN